MNPLNTAIQTACLCIVLTAGAAIAAAEGDAADSDPGVVQCANLIYGSNKTSVCYSDQFLTQISRETHIKTTRRFDPVKLESDELFEFPFSVMTGEGAYKLTDAQRENMRDYLLNGGFIIASAGCSSKDWNASFEREMRQMFPDDELVTLDADHPIFHAVYDVTSSKYKSGSQKLPVLKGLEVDGKIVLIWSPDGLNDTANAGPNCCCCGGNEVKSAKLLNVNILAYALTH